MEKDPIVYLNDEYLPAARARMSPLDRGFLFGDAVYEVIRSQNGKLFYYQPHIERLRNSLTGIGLEFNDYETLEGVAAELLSANDLNKGAAFIYLQISRGAYAQRSHEFPSSPPTPTVFVMAFASQSSRPASLRLVSHPDERWLRANLKTTNLLANVLAKQWAVEQQAQEVVLVRDRIAVECSSSALARVKNNVVYTHPPAEYLLPSITMQAVKDLCRAEKVAFMERSFTLEEAYDADELLVASTVKDVVPAVALDGRPIGGGKPGRIAHQLMDAFAGLVEEG